MTLTINQILIAIFVVAVVSGIGSLTLAYYLLYKPRASLWKRRNDALLAKLELKQSKHESILSFVRQAFQTKIDVKNDFICWLMAKITLCELKQHLPTLSYRGHAVDDDRHCLDFSVSKDRLKAANRFRRYIQEYLEEIKLENGLVTDFEVRIFAEAQEKENETIREEGRAVAR